MSFLKNPVIIVKKPTAAKTNSTIISRDGFSFNIVASYFEKIESTTKRLQKNEYLSKLVIQMSIKYPDDIPNLFLLLSNQVREPWQEG